MATLSDKYIAIIKDEHHYIFRYTDGEEPGVLKRVLEYAKDNHCNLDWQDVVHFVRRLREIMLEDIHKRGAMKP